MSENPKVFVSHASEDKERFVLDFAKKLRSIGIDAWLDKWEMLPGDSLVDKIFEEGIKEADSFIVVLSVNSINKPWIREELNTAIVKRISDKTKIIPIVLDNVEVPECLRSTLYESIKNVENYDEAFSRIKNSILGINDKPALGQIPDYVNKPVLKINGLNNIDNLIIENACKIAIEKGSEKLIGTIPLYEKVSDYGISKDDFKASIDILHRKGYLNGMKTMSKDNPYPFVDVNFISLENYIRENYNDYETTFKATAIDIVNGYRFSEKIAKTHNISITIINHIFETLSRKGLINFTTVLSGNRIINDVSPELNRILSE